MEQILKILWAHFLWKINIIISIPRSKVDTKCEVLLNYGYGTRYYVTPICVTLNLISSNED